VAWSALGPCQNLSYCRHHCLNVSFASNGLASHVHALGQTIILPLACVCDLVSVSVTCTRETKPRQFEQLYVECTALVISKSNHRVGVPMLLEYWEWRYKVRKSQLCGFQAAPSHIAIRHWLLVVFKSVEVGGVGTVSVRRPNAPCSLLASSGALHHSRDYARHLFVSGVPTPQRSRIDKQPAPDHGKILVSKSAKNLSPCNFPGTRFSCFSPFLECDSPLLLAHCR